MHRIVAGGTGFIGQQLVKHWLNNGVDVTVIGRDKNKIKHIFGTEVNALDWQDVKDPINLSTIQTADTLVNLCGEDIGKKRWGKKRKQAILQSRLDTTQNCVDLCLACGDTAPTLFNASGVGIYGSQPLAKTGLGPALDESTPLPKPENFMADVSQQWERVLQPLIDNHFHVVIMRFGVVLDPRGGVLARLTKPFRLGLGQVFGSGRQAFSWISLEDLIAAIDFISIHPDMSGAINVTAPNCVDARTLSQSLARALHRPCWLRTPTWLIRLLFGRMGVECLTEGQNVAPKRLLDAGFTFYHPTLDNALQYYFKSQ